MTILYEKVGRRYRPVRDTSAYDGLTPGTWLVVVDRGCTSIRRAVNGVSDAEAALLAACRRFEDVLCDEISKASALRPAGHIKASPLEQRAYKAFFDVMGESAKQSCGGLIRLERASAAEIAERAVARLAEWMMAAGEELITRPRPHPHECPITTAAVTN